MAQFPPERDLGKRKKKWQTSDIQDIDAGFIPDEPSQPAQPAQDQGFQPEQMPFKPEFYKAPQEEQPRSFWGDIKNELLREHFDPTKDIEALREFGGPRLKEDPNTVNEMLSQVPYGMGHPLSWLFGKLAGEKAAPIARGFASGAGEGAAKQLAGFSSDVGLGTIALPELEGIAAANTAAKTAAALRLARRATGAGLAYSSAAPLSDPNASWLDKLMSVPGVAGGLAMLFGPPIVSQYGRGELAVPSETPTPPLVEHGPAERISKVNYKIQPSKQGGTGAIRMRYGQPPPEPFTGSPIPPTRGPLTPGLRPAVGAPPTAFRPTRQVPLGELRGPEFFNQPEVPPETQGAVPPDEILPPQQTSAIPPQGIQALPGQIVPEEPQLDNIVDQLRASLARDRALGTERPPTPEQPEPVDLGPPTRQGQLEGFRAVQPPMGGVESSLGRGEPQPASALGRKPASLQGPTESGTMGDVLNFPEQPQEDFDTILNQIHNEGSTGLFWESRVNPLIQKARNLINRVTDVQGASRVANSLERAMDDAGNRGMQSHSKIYSGLFNDLTQRADLMGPAGQRGQVFPFQVGEQPPPNEQAFTLGETTRTRYESADRDYQASGPTNQMLPAVTRPGDVTKYSVIMGNDPNSFSVVDEMGIPKYSGTYEGAQAYKNARMEGLDHFQAMNRVEPSPIPTPEKPPEGPVGTAGRKPSRDFHDIYSDLWDYLSEKIPEGDKVTDRYFKNLLAQARRAIFNETDPAIIRDNFDIADQATNDATLDNFKARGKGQPENPDLPEFMNYLRDMALDKLRQSGWELDPRTGRIYPKRLPPDKPIGTAGQLPPEYQPGEPIDEAVSEQGGAKRGVNVQRASDEVTTGYSRHLPSIMLREMFQNAIDAVRHLGDAARVHIDISGDGGQIRVSDNGPGIGKAEFQKELVDLYESGKVGDPKASGGKGIGTASYMFGGEHVSVTSVREVNGQKIRTSMQGTPADFDTHVPIIEEVVDPSTPTGTTVSTVLKQSQMDDLANIHSMARQLYLHNRDLPGRMTINFNDPHELVMTGQELGHQNKVEHDNVLIDTDIEGNNVTISLPKNVGRKTYDNNTADIKVLNNGVFQYEDSVPLNHQTPGLPEKIIVDIKPTAKEGTEEYPFPTDRESVKDNIQDGIERLVQQLIADPLYGQRKSLNQETYDNMAKLGTGTRGKVLFDPGTRLNPNEVNRFQNSPFVKAFTSHLDNFINDTLDKIGIENWSKRLERVGITLDPDHLGLHVPNPGSENSTILINPFEIIKQFPNDPVMAARAIVRTIYHEIGHIGKNENIRLQLDKVDLTDPHMGDFLQGFFSEMWRYRSTGDPGHAIQWLSRVGETYTQVGPVEDLNARQAIEQLIATKPTKSGWFRGPTGYTPEIQELLRLYNERAGRTDTTTDYLSRTGVKSEAPISGEGDIQRNVESDREGFIGTTGSINPPPEKPSTQQVNEIKQQIPNESIPIRVRNILRHYNDALRESSFGRFALEDEEINHLTRFALNANRTMLTSYDISAPGRQGLPLIYRKEWWQAWEPMIKSWGSKGAYDLVESSILNDPSKLFERNITLPDGRLISKAEKAGLVLMGENLGKPMANEYFRSRYMEKNMPGVSNSKRAFDAYVSKLRADTFKNMVKEMNAGNNEPLMKDIADFVNVSTGHGNLGKLERASATLADYAFAPRFIASRVQMYTRLFNPRTYTTLNPQLRNAAWKSIFGLVGTGYMMGQMIKAVVPGAEVSSDPYSSDFGKIKIGDTRIDPYAGMQQYAVFAARMMPRVHIPEWSPVMPDEDVGGYFTSSTAPQTYDLSAPDVLRQKGDPTRADVVTRFAAQKLAPLPALFWAWAQNREFNGMPFDMQNAIKARVTPIVIQDLWDIYKQDPDAIPGGLEMLSALIGMGVQTYGRDLETGESFEPSTFSIF